LRRADATPECTRVTPDAAKGVRDPCGACRGRMPGHARATVTRMLSLGQSARDRVGKRGGKGSGGRVVVEGGWFRLAGPLAK